MRKNNVTVKDHLWALKGIPIPYGWLAALLAMTLLSTYAGLNISLFTGNMVDAGGDVPTRELVKFSAMYILIGVAAAGNTIFSSYASERVNLGLRTKLWQKIIYARGDSYEGDSGSSLVSRVTSDCDFSSRLLTTIVEIIGLAVSLGISVGQMFRLNQKLALAMIWLVPVSALFGWGYAKLRFLIARKTQTMLAGTTAYLVERTKSLNLIKTSGTREKETLAGMEHFDRQYETQIKTGLMDVGYVAMQHLFSIFSVLIPFLVGAELVQQRVVRVGVIIAFYSIATSVGTLATNFINSAGTIKQAGGALSRVIAVLKMKDERRDTGLSMDVPNEDISIREVSFAYGEKQALREISCEIPKNKVTALIGTNGSGKSTLFRLLDRLADPDRGAILFGNTDAAEFDRFEWRKAFCMVSQGSSLLEGTIRENLCYGCRRPVSDEEMLSVARRTHVDDFVSKLPQGYDTPVAAGGGNFSGGQRQLMAIARAMLNNPDYLLLDEATSNLDAHHEAQVLEALESLMKGRTTVVIAHSLAAIRKAEHVIILKDGEIEQTGAPEEILRQTGNYLEKIAGRGPRCDRKEEHA